MTQHGGERDLKRLNTPKFLQIKRKTGKYFVKPSPGPHKNRFCLPLLHIVRDLFKIADNYDEAKKLIARGMFWVDGKPVYDIKYPVGLMDVLTIKKANRHFRILPSRYHQFKILEISEEASKFKLCKINNKTTIKGGHIQLNLHDGKNILVRVQDPRNPKEDVYNTMDVLKISLPDLQILKVIKFKEGNIATIYAGLEETTAIIGKLFKISKRFGPFASTTTIKEDSGREIETLYDYTFMLGEDSLEIDFPPDSPTSIKF